jgi:16S rRNA (uracil1498-N3)-methyltransferase
MEPPVFLVSPEHRDGDLAVLPPDEAHHAHKVLRLSAGALVMIVDGLGSAWRAELVAVTSRQVKARLLAEVRGFGEPKVTLTLAAGLSTASKFDSVVQRGTELGVSRFVPLLTEKSTVSIDDPHRMRTRSRRLAKVATAAVKQCRRSQIPEIALPTMFDDFLAQCDGADLNLIFHPGKQSRPLHQVELPARPPRVLLAVGPEAALQAGFQAVSLGRRVLRTETAGPTAVALIMDRLGELS